MRQILFALVTVLLVAVIAVLLWRYAQEDKPKGLKESLPITRYVLGNGLTVLVVENHRIPAVSHTLFIKAGSADDPPGKSGLAHFAEHMLFKGTPTVSGEEYDRRIAAMGAENNAYTTTDFTAYYVNAPVASLEQVMALEADRFMNLVVDENVAKTELKVIQEERHMRVDSDPGSVLAEQMNAVQFLSHPYRIPIIGWAHDIAGLTARDVAGFIQTHYQPANMVLMVAGDVTPTEVRRLAMRYYGPMKSLHARERAWAGEPQPVAAKAVQLADGRVQQPQWVRQYRAPSFGGNTPEEVIALELVSQWLGGGKTGFLYQKLVVEQQLAVDVSVGYYGAKIGPGMFTVQVVPKDGVAMATVAQAVDTLLTQALAQGPDAESVERAKTLYVASITYAQDGLTPVASYIGTLAMLGKDESLFYGLEAMIRAATAEQMVAAAKAVLVPENSVTGELLVKETTHE